MSKSSMKFILRHLRNNGLYSFIKIASLTLGMLCILLAILFVRDENSYDKFHANANHLYRITTSTRDLQDGKTQIIGATGQIQGPAFKEKIPEIEEYVRIWPGLSTNFIADQKALLINYIYADKSFFKVFSFPLIYGNAADALNSLNSIVLTEQTALRFFGKTEVIGKTIRLEEGHGTATFLITGIAKSLPVHSSIRFEAVLPFKYLQTMFPDENWLNSYLTTYVLLNPKADPGIVKNKFEEVFLSGAAGQLKDAKMPGASFQFGLQPITDVHLNIFEKGAIADRERVDISDPSISTYSYLLMGIAIFILIMACVNFLNLSIAGSLKRAKEIGVRKISGGTRSQIVAQFLTESSILCGLSYLLAVSLVIGFLPAFNQLAQKNISLSFRTAVLFSLYGIILMAICIIIAGLYPAFKLSMFKVVEVLYNKQKIKENNYVTKGLIVLQFTLSASLLLATLIYYRQMNYITHKDLGYQALGIIKMDLPPYRNPNQRTVGFLRKELMMESGIIQVANGELTPGDGAEVKVNDRKFSSNKAQIDQFFVSTLEIPVNQGRNFSAEFVSDSSQSVIVNETFVKEAGIKNPIGKQVTMTNGLNLSYSKTIIGVVKDYHYRSVKEKIGSLILELHKYQPQPIWIKFKTGHGAQALSAIESVYKNTFPEYFFQYAFLDDENRTQFANDQRWKSIIRDASVLAILICCIGLFGVAHFDTIKRTKEIGIRKVLGASAINLSILLSRDFLKLVLLSIIISSPLSWYTMNKWLQNFNYRIVISWQDYFLAGIISLMIALATVSSKTFGSATANPVSSLRTD